MKYIAFLFFIVTMACIAFLFGCTSHSAQESATIDKGVFIKHKDQIEPLRKYLNQISENNTFPHIVESLKKSMHNPDRFEFIRAKSSLHEKRTKRPSGTHITYYYQIRIHFRGENAFGALRLSHQDFALYPDGTIRTLPKKR